MTTGKVLLLILKRSQDAPVALLLLLNETKSLCIDNRVCLPPVGAFGFDAGPWSTRFASSYDSMMERTHLCRS